jgi:hypothetical protein
MMLVLKTAVAARGMETSTEISEESLIVQVILRRSGSLQRSPEMAISEAVRMKPKSQWMLRMFKIPGTWNM